MPDSPKPGTAHLRALAESDQKLQKKIRKHPPGDGRGLETMLRTQQSLLIEAGRILASL